MRGDETSQVYLLERVLVLAPEQEGVPFCAKCKLSYEPKTQAIDFAPTLHHLSALHPSLARLLHNAQLFYVDTRTRTKQFLGEYPLDDPRMLFDDWTTNRIVISYRKHEPPPPAAASEHRHTARKSRERTIREVRAEIERWREVARASEGAKGGMSLLQAARAIGVSKKSLDDYLRCLRAAERLNFNFQAFEGEKMGFLRAFVKSRLHEPNDGARLQTEIDSYWDSTYVGREVS